MSDGLLYADEEIILEAGKYWLGLTKLTKRARGRLQQIINTTRRS